MNIPEIKSYEEQAIDAVVAVLNRAKESLGERQTLRQLAAIAIINIPSPSSGLLRNETWDNLCQLRNVVSLPPKKHLPSPTEKNRQETHRNAFSSRAKVALSSLKCPLAITSEDLIRKTIEKTWKLTENLMYFLKYIGSSKDECSQYYYFEAVFSQPIPAYPIPQATASVFFRVEDMQIEPMEIRDAPKVTFRVEGHHTDHDIRYVRLVPDWILSVIQMKIKLFRRIEQIRLF